jgi:hypothetical protein
MRGLADRQPISLEAVRRDRKLEEAGPGPGLGVEAEVAVYLVAAVLAQMPRVAAAVVVPAELFVAGALQQADN